MQDIETHAAMTATPFEDHPQITLKFMEEREGSDVVGSYVSITDDYEEASYSFAFALDPFKTQILTPLHRTDADGEKSVVSKDDLPALVFEAADWFLNTHVQD